MRAMTGPMHERGMTLTEVLVASALALVIIVGIGTVDVSRVRTTEDVRRRSGILAADQGQAALTAVLHLTKHVEAADLVELRDDGTNDILLVRTPSGCAANPDPNCFDDPANYQWDQYRLVQGELRFYENVAAGCVTVKTLARQVASLVFSYSDEALAPPGGEPLPGGADNNTFEFRIGWNDGRGTTREFPGQVSIRAGAYTNLSTGLYNGPPGTAPVPPASCA